MHYYTQSDELRHLREELFESRSLNQSLTIANDVAWDEIESVRRTNDCLRRQVVVIAGVASALAAWLGWMLA